ncbi:MAG TPA: hypothetical protein VML54_04180, partial [Candidatus Limnocylindrales bacterium]|nr:hypothetical protein [Candidatus Limnocylindrales bacterium]
MDYGTRAPERRRSPGRDRRAYDTSGNLDWVQRIGAAPLPQASSTVVLGQSIAVNADGSGVFVAGYTN